METGADRLRKREEKEHKHRVALYANTPKTETVSRQQIRAAIRRSDPNWKAQRRKKSK